MIGKQLRCIAIDDEPLALELIRDYCTRIPSLLLANTFEDAVSGAEFLNKNQTDLLFIDINMPDITGLDLVRSLKQRPMTIFTTAYRNFALEGFELEAIDYLLKPIEFGRFAKAVGKAQEYHNYRSTAREEEPDSIFIYSEYKLIKVRLSDIEYIESLQDYIRIHLSAGKPVLSLMPLKKILEKLPENRFRRIHRSFIVSLSRIKSIHNKKVTLECAIELPVSDSYSDVIDSFIKK